MIPRTKGKTDQNSNLEKSHLHLSPDSSPPPASNNVRRPSHHVHNGLSEDHVAQNVVQPFRIDSGEEGNRIVAPSDESEEEREVVHR